MKMIEINDEEPLRGVKIKIYPTKDQIDEIEKNIATSRAIYNMALYIQKTNYEKGIKFTKYFDMIRIFYELKEKEEYSWMKEVSVGTIECALKNLDDAYNLFFKKASNFPRYKTKKSKNQAVSMRSDASYPKGNYFKVSGIKGLIKTNYPIYDRHTKIHNVCISTNGYGDYWLSFSIYRKRKDMSNVPVSDPIGVDVGVRNLITTSDGEYFHLPDVSKLEKKKKRLDRHTSKYQLKYLNESIHTKTKYEDIPKSKRYDKLMKKRWKVCNKISDIYRTYIHNSTKKIVQKNPSAIVIETVRSSDMVKHSRTLRKESNKMMFYEIHKQIKYKANDRGIPVFIADKYFPSSQLCSRCGFRQKVSSSIYKCPICGLEIDRDLNAAYNLRDLAIS